jgi:hypothetical protein
MDLVRAVAAQVISGGTTSNNASRIVELHMPESLPGLLTLRPPPGNVAYRRRGRLTGLQRPIQQPH